MCESRVSVTNDETGAHGPPASAAGAHNRTTVRGYGDHLSHYRDLVPLLLRGGAAPLLGPQNADCHFRLHFSDWSDGWPLVRMRRSHADGPKPCLNLTLCTPRSTERARESGRVVLGTRVMSAAPWAEITTETLQQPPLFVQDLRKPTTSTCMWTRG